MKPREVRDRGRGGGHRTVARIVLRLAHGPACSRDLYGNYNQRISELRHWGVDGGGFEFGFRPCTRHHHPEAPGLRERFLTSVPEEWR